MVYLFVLVCVSGTGNIILMQTLVKIIVLVFFRRKSEEMYFIFYGINSGRVCIKDGSLTLISVNLGVTNPKVMG